MKLTIWIDPEWQDHPTVQAWREQGHQITLLPLPRPDLILSRVAWRWDDDLWPYADLPLTATRKTKRKERS